MSKIVIGIACHKPFEAPDNDLYLPIAVGAALRDTPIPGAQPDDEGDNISAKNPQYCELTAQYWLWKNVEADYYGLCHYRRFLSFSDERFTTFTPDNREHVLVPEINPDSKRKYHLDDEAGMRAIIESVDIVAPQEQNLSRIYTPHGHKRSVYAHFAAHDHDLINVNDLDAMIAIVHERYPQYAADMDEYLSGPMFRGFNCFVMRRELFFELCAYEFDVLSELERMVDLRTYDTTRARIYGFMAEIISSAFIYHVIKRGRARVRDVQMLYFKSSDPIAVIKPSAQGRTVVLNAVGLEPCLLAVPLRSFLETIDSSKPYDLVVVHGTRLTPFFRKKYRSMLESFDNVTLSFIDWTVKAPAFEDAANATSRNAIGASLHCALPWLLPLHERAIVFEPNVLLSAGWHDMLDLDLHGNVTAAAPDVEWIGTCNSVYSDTRQFAREFLGLENPLACASTAVVVMDLAAIRDVLDPADIAIVLGSFERTLEAPESFNVIFENSIERLDLRYNVRLSTDEEFDLRVGDLPIELNADYRRACKAPAVICYDPSDPYWGEADHVLEFWRLARMSPFYENMIEHLVSIHVAAGKQGRNAVSAKRRMFNGLAPEGSKRRALVRKLIPWNSPISRRLRSLVERF